MNQNAMKTLEYEKIKETLASYALSEQCKERIRSMKPSTDIKVVEEWMRETTEGRAIVNISSSIPIHSLTGIDAILGKINKGGVLYPEDLSSILELLREGKKLKRFMESKALVAPKVSAYSMSIYTLADLEDEIDRCIHGNRVADKASAELSRTRKKISILEERIKSRIDSVLKNNAYSRYLQDSVVSIRNGRYVIPIKSEYRKNVEGSVLDSSASGSTVFVEPAEVKKIHDELNILRIAEEQEVYKILCQLTNLAESYKREISINIEIMEQYDFIFAKAKYSKSLDCSPVRLNTKNHINIIGGRHPLIGLGAVPLNFTIGDGYRSLVITGPNTGGKTVVLKTVGLFTLMAQSGLHIPADRESELGVFWDILVDIGDGQSIEQSLSTFSSHIKNIIDILKCSDSHSLVILDELGAGTDPGEGMGIAIAVLENIYGKGSTILATTHYSEIKDFAREREGFKNGSMDFDITTLKPLYKLNIGIAGESNAFLISLRLGMDKTLIERAHEITYKERKVYHNFIEEVAVKTSNLSCEDDMFKKHIEQIDKQREIERKRNDYERKKIIPAFNIGDCVYINTMDRTGIVCEAENSKGEITVMVMKKKLKVNKKRLSLYIDNKELYPEDYDYSIVLESKENRKKEKLLSKRHIEGLSIVKGE